MSNLWSPLLFLNVFIDKITNIHICVTHTFIIRAYVQYISVVDDSFLYCSSTVHDVLMPTCSYVTAAAASQRTFMLK